MKVSWDFVEVSETRHVYTVYFIVRRKMDESVIAFEVVYTQFFMA